MSVQPVYTVEAFLNGSWVDLSSRLRRGWFERGKDEDLAPHQPGHGELILDNRDRALDDNHTGSPYYPHVKPGVFVRLKILTSPTKDLLYGRAEKWAQETDGNDDLIAVVPITDYFFDLADVTLPSAFEIEVRNLNATAWVRFGEKEGELVAVDSINRERNGTYEPEGKTHNAESMVFGDENPGWLSHEYAGLEVSNTKFVKTPAMVSGSSTFALALNVRNLLPLLPHSDVLTQATQLVAQSDNGFTADWQILIYKADPNDTFWTLSARFQVGITFIFIPIIGAIPVPDPALELIFETNVFDDGGVHQVGIARSGSTTYRLYLDGQQVASSSGGPNFSTTHARVAVGLGRQIDGADAQWDIEFDELVCGPWYSGFHSALWEATTEPWKGDTPGGRIQRILDYAGHTGTRSIAYGASTLAPANIAGQSALEHIQDVELTEGGRFFIAGSGIPVFLGRRDLLTGSAYGTLQATFGDDRTNLPYRREGFELVPAQLEDVITEARISSDVNSEVYFVDDAAADQYGHRTFDFHSLEETVEGMLAQAHAVVANFKDPYQQIRQVVVAPRHPRNSWNTVAALDLAHRVRGIRTPMSTGTTIDQTANVGWMRWDFDPDNTEITYRLSPADTRDYWRIGVHGSSEIGVTTRLAR